MEKGSGGGLRAAPMGTEGWCLLLCLALSGAAADTGEWEQAGGKSEAREAPDNHPPGEELSPRGERLSG